MSSEMRTRKSCGRMGAQGILCFGWAGAWRHVVLLASPIPYTYSPESAPPPHAPCCYLLAAWTCTSPETLTAALNAGGYGFCLTAARLTGCCGGIAAPLRGRYLRRHHAEPGETQRR